MAKIALLIGVSEYGEGLGSLPGTQEDVVAMQRVLQNTQIAAFDSVELLCSPDRIAMERAIETLFTENRSRDDLILLYFSGHGVRGDNGTLYFANRSTEKNAQGRIRTSTAVPASALLGYMSQSRSKRQVLILDCCFSGAFANDMKAKQADEAIDLNLQLGGEGRAVLTSSTATQISYEKDGAGIYTRYLVQGLETGAADRDENGEITVDELHEYAKEKVREAAPSMQPEIYAVREGYKILLARAPQGDPRLTYRKELDERAKQKRGKLSPIDQWALKFRCQELGLSDPEAEEIATEVLQPYRIFWEKVTEFEQAVTETLHLSPQLNADDLDDLRYFQRVLQLRDEDIAPILSAHHLTLDRPPETGASTTVEPSTQVPVQTKSSAANADTNRPPQNLATPPEDDLRSEKGINYTRLRDLLKAQQWQDADQETYARMLEMVGRKEGSCIWAHELETLPCTDLKTIDSLWVKYSNGRFGFSVQKQIWQECGSPTQSRKDWDRFCVQVGWKNSNAKTTNVGYSKLKFDTEKSPAGELPFVCWSYAGGVWMKESVLVFSVHNQTGCEIFSSLASRLVECNR